MFVPETVVTRTGTCPLITNCATALRTVWVVDLPKGRHQLRVASVHAATGRGGAVYLDVDVSDESSVSRGVFIASRLLSHMPTVFSDERLALWTAAMPTATREFPEGDILTVTVPGAVASRTTARLTNTAGRVVWEGAGAPVEGAVAARFVVPLEGIGTPVCDLTVEGTQGSEHTTIGVVPREAPVAKEDTAYFRRKAANSGIQRHTP